MKMNKELREALKIVLAFHTSGNGFGINMTPGDPTKEVFDAWYLIGRGTTPEKEGSIPEERRPK